MLVDPLPLSELDWTHLQSLGGAAWIVITNSDRIRASQEIAEKTGAQIAALEGEKATFSLPIQRWLGDGDLVVSGLNTLA